MTEQEFNNQEPNPMPVLSLNLGDVAVAPITDTISLQMTVVGIARGLDCGGIAVMFSSKLLDSTEVEPTKKNSANEGSDSVGVVHTCASDSGQTVYIQTLAGTLNTTENGRHVRGDKVWATWQEMVDDLPPLFSKKDIKKAAMFELLGKLLGDK